MTTESNSHYCIDGIKLKTCLSVRAPRGMSFHSPLFECLSGNGRACAVKREKNTSPFKIDLLSEKKQVRTVPPLFILHNAEREIDTAAADLLLFRHRMLPVLLSVT